jgi:hypothetical protein
MQIRQNVMSFKALNVERVATEDKKFINKYFKKLETLGKNYDITISSSEINGTAIDIPSLEIIVRPLSAGLGFFEKLFSPSITTDYPTKYKHLFGMDNDETILSIVKNSIAKLDRSMSK